MLLTNMYKGKRVAVSGATGLIGSNLIKRLLQFDMIHIVAIGRNMKKLEVAFGELIHDGRISFLEHDMIDPLPESLGKVDYFFHAAGSVSGVDVRTIPVSIVSANLNGAVHALEYIRRQQDRKIGQCEFIVFSSATVYGYPTQESICTEKQTEHAEAIDSAMAAYSESKRMVEVIAHAYEHQYAIPIRIARFGYVYGPCPIPQKNALYDSIEKAGMGGDIVFRTPGLARRDNIYVSDAVEGVLAMCEFGVPGEAYNISSFGWGGNYAAIDELVHEIASLARADGIDVRMSIPASTCRAAGLRMDNSKLQQLGWAPRTSLSEGVRETCLYFWGRQKEQKGARV